MIGVVADDLTGAAELGAVGLRHGLRAEVLLAGPPSDDPDLVCLDTDSRSRAPGEAADLAARAARGFRQHRAAWVYKKTDSVLRGNVTPELEALVAELGLDGALLVPANPSLGRTIVGGRYFVRGELIHETEFARDPAHPRLSSNVRELIAPPTALPLVVRRAEEGLPQRGMVMGEAANPDDLRKWAALRNDRWLMAGGAEFFDALLREEMAGGISRAGGDPAVRSFLDRGGRQSCRQNHELFVCGSASPVTRQFVARQAELGVPVFSLPQELASGGGCEGGRLTAVAAEVGAALEAVPRVVLHVGLPPVAEAAVADRLALHLVGVAEQVLLRADVGLVYASGGATAAALARRMGWTRLEVVAELAAGVVAVTIAGRDRRLVLTIKPGSYEWPESLLKA